jgi:hypothetical protein
MTGSLVVTGRLSGTSTACFGGAICAPILFVTSSRADFVGIFQNSNAATPYTLRVQEPASAASGYPLLQVTNNAGSIEYFRVDSCGAVGINQSPSSAYRLSVTGNTCFGGMSIVTSCLGIGTASPSRVLEISKTGGVDFGVTSVTSGAAEAIFKGYANGTNIDATTSRGSVISLMNLDTTNGNANAIVFHNSNQLATSYISGVNVNHTSRTGDIVFGTSNAAAPTERMRITNTGNVGVGTTNPVDCIIGSGIVLEVAGTAGGSVKLRYTSATNYGEFSFYKGTNGSFIDSAGAATLANNDIIFRTGGTVSNYGVTERMRIDSSGVVRLQKSGDSQPIVRTTSTTGARSATWNFQEDGTNIFQIGFWKGNSYDASHNAVLLRAIGADDIHLMSCDITRMIVTSGGLVGINTLTPVAPLQVVCTPGSFYGIIETTACTAGTAKHFRVHKPNYVEYGIGILDNNSFHISTASTFPTTNGFTLTSAGIACFGGTVCAPCFATISDYRMKSNLRPIQGLSIIMNAKPYKFDYNYDCSTSFGMIAHELQEIVPEAVFGVKDDEVMQGVDYMKLLPIAIKAIQELKCENDIFKTCLGII